MKDNPPIASSVVATTAMTGHAEGLEGAATGAALDLAAGLAAVGNFLPQQSHQPSARSEGLSVALQWMQAFISSSGLVAFVGRMMVTIARAVPLPEFEDDATAAG